MASIRKRVRKDGTASWQVMWRDEDGIQSGITFHTEPEAKNLKRALDANGGSYAIAEKVIAPQLGKRTVADVANEHIDLLTKPTAQVIHMYRAYVAHHIMDSIGGVPIDELDRTQLTAWVRGLMVKPTTPGRTMAPATVKNIFGFLSAVMGTAIELRYITANPCTRVELPDKSHVEDDSMFLTLREFQALWAHMDKRFRPLISFLVMTGARFGEATAVTIADVNTSVTPATVRINKAWKSDGRGNFFIGAPKTKASKRTIAIPDGLTRVITPLMEGRGAGELLFTDAKGGRVKHINFRRTYWENALQGTKEDDSTFTKTPKPHGLRHTHASWLIQEGVELFKVARRLGHTNTNMIETTYGHLMPDAQADSVSALGRAMMGDVDPLKEIES
jgi:integrase